MIDIYSAIEMADKYRDEIVLCLLGAPGIGKTESVYRFAKDHDRNVVEIIASQILPNEVSGITMPINETKSMEIFDHVRLSNLKDGDILFFDELLEAAPSTLAACLTLIQERRLMSGKMLPDVLIVAASNPLSSPTMIKPSIRQRFMFINCDYREDEFKSYIYKKFGIMLPDSVLELVEIKDNGSYNLLTPRSLTKILGWLLKCNENWEAEIVLNIIENMYGYHVRKVILEFFADREKYSNYIDACKETVSNILRDNALNDNDSSFKWIPNKMNELMDLDTAEDIAKFLAEIEEGSIKDAIVEALSSLGVDDVSKEFDIEVVDL